MADLKVLVHAVTSAVAADDPLDLDAAALSLLDHLEDRIAEVLGPVMDEMVEQGWHAEDAAGALSTALRNLASRLEQAAEDQD